MSHILESLEFYMNSISTKYIISLDKTFKYILLHLGCVLPQWLHELLTMIEFQYKMVKPDFLP